MISRQFSMVFQLADKAQQMRLGAAWHWHFYELSAQKPWRTVHVQTPSRPSEGSRYSKAIIADWIRRRSRVGDRLAVFSG